MKDIEVAMGDNNKTITLEASYQYEKEEVQFNSMQQLKDCVYLGGNK